MAFDFSQFPVLSTPRLELIEITPGHMGDIFGIFGNPEVTRYYNVETLEAVEDAKPIVDWFTLKFNDKKGLRWGISIKGEGRVIGTIGINNFTWGQKGVIGYDLAQAYWNKGYASEALQAVVQFGFDVFGLNRIEAEVMPGNTGSEKLLTRCGFAFEGTIRQSLFWQGRWYDMNMYSILSSEQGINS
jgi:ribosomal-protein-alanine N-acetyltransferase